MWKIDLNQYISESILESCRKQCLRVYPEYPAHFLGVSQDKESLIAEITFPDGTFYFRVTENSVSSAYNTLDEADQYV